MSVDKKVFDKKAWSLNFRAFNFLQELPAASKYESFKLTSDKGELIPGQMLQLTFALSFTCDKLDRFSSRFPNKVYWHCNNATA